MITRIKKQNGFVLLFTVMLCTIILAIALGISNIAFKEERFSTSGKDTNDSFFAADVGVECALFYDKKSGANRFIWPNPGTSMNCASASPNPSPSGNSTLWSYSFIVYGLANSGQACAKVTVTKDNTVPPVQTTIVSDGYNLGGPSCNSSSQNLVERELKATFK